MALSPALTTKLLGAIETDALILLCGAGLSIPGPSFLRNAAQVAQACYDTRQPLEVLPQNLRDDIDALAGLFHARGEFNSVFVPLVPWNDLAGAPNEGHIAVADFLICRAVHGALSANFDTMIERWASHHKIAMRGALTGQEAVNFGSVSNPLLKFHGCMVRDLERTLWTHGQLAEPVIADRVQSCSNWMNLNLPGKHLVVIGFWTDWGYLNDVLANAFAINNASSVTVVDPTVTVELEQKAPILWAKLNGLSNSFEHVQASGADVLRELRTEYSKCWMRKFYALGQPSAQATGIAVTPIPNAYDCDELYDLRRDVEGVPYTRAATLKAPPNSASEASLMHFEMLNAGAAVQGAWFDYAGQSVRIINGAGRALSDVQQASVEPASIPQPRMVVCAGAFDPGVPGRLIASGHGRSIMRPSRGGGARWLTREHAKTELGL